jgi:hypothetical protein
VNISVLLLFESEGANLYTVLAQTLPTLFWIIVIAIVLRLFRLEIQQILSYLLLRLQLGASLKIGSLELGTTYVAPDTSSGQNLAGIEVEEDDDTRENEHAEILNDWRFLAVVHRLSPSSRPGQRYDALVYLTMYGDNNLLGVTKVSYYLGPWWGGQVFTTSDRSNSFALLTSARAPFLCTAHVFFTDGKKTTITRYVDFEMGQTGAIAG